MFGLTSRRLVFILIILAVVLLARQYVPPYYARFQFGDAVRQTVKYAAAANRSMDGVKREILRSAEDSGVPITEKDIIISKRGIIFTVDIDYAWPIDLRVYKHEIPFHISESGETFEK
jgi:hypothetical protein